MGQVLPGEIELLMAFDVSEKLNDPNRLPVSLSLNRPIAEVYHDPDLGARAHKANPLRSYVGILT